MALSPATNYFWLGEWGGHFLVWGAAKEEGQPEWVANSGLWPLGQWLQLLPGSHTLSKNSCTPSCWSATLWSSEESMLTVWPQAGLSLPAILSPAGDQRAASEFSSNFWCCHPIIVLQCVGMLELRPFFWRMRRYRPWTWEPMLEGCVLEQKTSPSSEGFLASGAKTVWKPTYTPS